MKLLQFTDIHLTAPGQTIGGRDPNANFDRALDHALGHHPDAEALIITGDLSDWGDRADYERLRARIDALPLPVHLLIGNHDDRTRFLEVFPNCAGTDGWVQSVVPLTEGTAILLDTWAPQTHKGHYCAARRRWLADALAAASAPVYLFMHHNPIPTFLIPEDRIMLHDAEAFGAVLAPHRQRIRHIFFGHCHVPLAGSFHGIPVSCPRGTNHAGFANFRERDLLTRSTLPESYALILTQGPAVTVHMIEFGHPGPLTVEGSPDYAAWDRTIMKR